MDADQVQIINDLKSNIVLLIAKLEKEKAEQIRIKNSNQDLQRKINIHEAKISDLEQKYTHLKIAKSLVAESGDIHEAKVKVNRIVREIDKCIALLNR
jgi:hypothetical protein